MPFMLQTARLELRELTDDDLDFVAGMVSHPEVMRHYPKLYSREEARGWIDRARKRYLIDGVGLWLALDRIARHPVGMIGLLRQDVETWPELEIGYLLHRPFWGQGFATEAATALRDYAFAHTRAPWLISLIRPDNLPSQSVARRVGMTLRRTAEFRDLPHLVFQIDRAT